MSYFKHGNVQIYYEDTGKGEPIIANHGLSEDVGYWADSGVTAELTKHYRFIPYEMRGHGRTIVETAPNFYDCDNMIEDINALADHLKLEKFHLLSHATGGMVAVRYGMKYSNRLLSLLLTDTGSATLPEMPPEYRTVMTDEERQKLFEEMRKAPIPNLTKAERKAQWMAAPGPYTFTIAKRPETERDRMWELIDNFHTRRLSQQAMRDFYTSFYTDPDVKINALRNIECPTLILLGEHDVVFLKYSAIMAKEIPNNKHVILKNVGHMTAIEAPQETAAEILGFLAEMKRKKSLTTEG